MIERLAADAVVLIHLGFIGFVAFGGLLVVRWPKIAWLHVPAAVWGAFIELSGTVCPLTPLENQLRVSSGGYEGGFIEHYLTPIVYPPGLTRGHQIALGAAVIGGNLALYAVACRHRRRHTQRDPSPHRPSC
jgi:hypothetical protein